MRLEFGPGRPLQICLRFGQADLGGIPETGWVPGLALVLDGQFRSLHADFPLIWAALSGDPPGQPRPRVPVTVLLLAGQRVTDLDPGVLWKAQVPASGSLGM